MSQMPDVLKKIVDYKTHELAGMKAAVPLDEITARLSDLEDHPRGFEAALLNSLNSGWTAIIAEVKKGSPSKGVIRADFDPLEIARIYQDNGASCLSVLTDEHFFLGHLSYLAQIREQVSLPLLRKDFIFDPYQIYQARAAGADAVLLIAAMLDLSQLRDFAALAGELAMDVLLEVHDERELETALQTDCRMIGINNRDLRSFVVDISTSERLAALIPEGRIIVAESGITRRDEIVRLTGKGLHAFLIGESLMREDDIGEKLRELLG
ncbi:MAG: indole-3-glycerol phosphate synthase [Geobacteraceae bacterium GWC2_58_44]|nr:MAG: indole-3-glycerol phosphate synthase [Geobacteraceae bacterium GWC2_58_44]HBG05703.1 indole-3-glycerol phosphate synthase TrpC [Geobacter sp.]